MAAGPLGEDLSSLGPQLLGRLLAILAARPKEYIVVECNASRLTDHFYGPAPLVCDLGAPAPPQECIGPAVGVAEEGLRADEPWARVGTRAAENALAQRVLEALASEDIAAVGHEEEEADDDQVGEEVRKMAAPAPMAVRRRRTSSGSREAEVEADDDALLDAAMAKAKEEASAQEVSLRQSPSGGGRVEHEAKEQELDDLLADMQGQLATEAAGAGREVVWADASDTASLGGASAPAAAAEDEGHQDELCDHTEPAGAAAEQPEPQQQASQQQQQPLPEDVLEPEPHPWRPSDELMVAWLAEAAAIEATPGRRRGRLRELNEWIVEFG